MDVVLRDMGLVVDLDERPVRTERIPTIDPAKPYRKCGGPH